MTMALKILFAALKVFEKNLEFCFEKCTYEPRSIADELIVNS